MHSTDLLPQLFKYACVYPLGKVVVDGAGWAKAFTRASVPGGSGTQYIEDALGDAPQVGRPRVPYLALS